MGYVEYANSDGQRKVAECLDKGITSSRKIAEEIGKDDGWVRRAAKAIKRRAQDKGYNPHYGMIEGYPDGYKFHKATIHRKADGTIIQVWDRMTKDQETCVSLALAIKDSFAHHVTPIDKIKRPSGSFNTDIIPWLEIGDAHIGMMAIESQVGHNFDLDIASGELKFAVTELIWRAEPCDRFVVHDVGDGTHFENESATTENSGHALDAAGPFIDVVRAYIDFITFTIEAALRRHNHVDVIISQGNHSRKNDKTTAVLLELLYANNPRVHILDNTTPFIPYRMGNTFVLCHHGDKVKPAGLAAIMAQDWAQDWGETFYHYIDGGHVHHSQVRKEQNGAIYESFNQLAPNDRYAYEGGWRSRSFLNLLYRSKTYGEKGREVLTAEEVKDRMDKLAPGATAQRRREVHTV